MYNFNSKYSQYKPTYKILLSLSDTFQLENKNFHEIITNSIQLSILLLQQTNG